MTRLRLLVAMETHDTLSAAACSVGISQPAASEQLRRLEAAAGQRLAERSGRGLHLTPEGHILAQRAAEALACLGAAEEELDAYAGLQTGTLWLGATPVPATYLLAEPVTRFAERFPGIEIEIDVAPTHEVLERLRDGRLQLAVLCAANAVEDVSLEPFLPDNIVGVAHPGMLPVREGRVDPAALSGHTLLSREQGSSWQARAASATAQAGVEWGRVWKVGSIESIKHFAKSGLGVGFLSRVALAGELKRDELEAFQVIGSESLDGWFSVGRLAYRELSPAEHYFVDTLAEAFGGRATRSAVPSDVAR